ncbi:MAG: hypothetical protein VX951_09295 [Planctomycetota bacterium]|nr:hypothetical protein [Planctomycetota bacterium]
MRIDTAFVTRWAKRLSLPVALLVLILFFRSYWFVVVPEGMDTMPEVYPPGTTCVVQRNPRHLVEGSVVFLEVEAGAAAILVRVAKVVDGRVYPAVDNPRSRFAGYAKEDYPVTSVRALVLSGVTPDSGVSGPPGNR